MSSAEAAAAAGQSKRGDEGWDLRAIHFLDKMQFSRGEENHLFDQKRAKLQIHEFFQEERKRAA